MIDCFLEPQDMRLPPKNTQKPEVNFLSSESKAHSTLGKPYRERTWGRLSNNP